MEMPKPGDVHERLSALIGEWIGDETMHPSPWDPAGSSAIGRVVNRWVADGFAVVQEYEQQRGDVVTFRGHGVFWFDPATQEYVMHWWDSMGGPVNEFRGQFSGDVLTLASPMPQGGQSRSSWTLAGPDAHAFLMEMSPDGENWAPAMEGRYRRAAAPKKTASAKTAKKRASPKSAASTKASRPAKASSRGPATKTRAKAGPKKAKTAAKKAARKRR